MKEIQINEVGQYLKDGFVLVVVEDRTFIQYKNQKIYLYNSQWHSTMPWSDFYPLYQKMHFVLYEEHQELVDEKKMKSIINGPQSINKLEGWKESIEE